MHVPHLILLLWILPDLSPFELSLPLESSSKKRKKVGSPPSTDTAMDLLKAITSPLATGSKSSKRSSEKSSHSSFSASNYSESKKEHHKKKPSGSSSDLSLEDGTFHKSKKIKPPYMSTETLTLCEPDGLKMKLILSPKEKGGSTAEEPFPHSAPSMLKKSSKKSSRDEQGSFLPSHDMHSFLKSSRKKHKPPPDPHTPPAAESFSPDTSLFPEGQSNEFELSGLEQQLESGSSSGGELEAGELVIDDSYREIKKKKKSKKSKKKKDKEKHKEKKHSKSKKSSGLSTSLVVSEVTASLPVSPSSTQFAVPAPPPPPPAPLLLPPPPPPPPLPPPPPPPVFHTDGSSEKKKKKEEKEKAEKLEKEKPKKKNMSAYQVFCKEYRVNIVADHPGIDFGELSKKLAEVWKQLPEKDKLVWKQKAQYLQHKQNKAEATTVKRKATSSEGAPKLKASLTGTLSPHKKSPSSTVVLSSSPVKVPETDPIDVAAHLQLLGESLSLIGHRLQETEGMVAVSGSLSVLLDSIICALGPLACLTSQLPELNGCPKHVLSNTLDNIAYIMPGL
ncbi:HMG domain-containing protein 4 isoform X2 [Hemicordylus capensis]|uniref:HMG domain-containing protein 4 isoform X2 n=1 Tax=Hemicordylus capensis TaxID=884348 RepID=UPI0023036C87|nr:HMG domain-containing protein 4 isoform X2 [Hemicordylus capensis]XP_053112979.1 HMG domain-containing protein 4 isoform X2 [Hemicordylus capensis]XP_053112980.1 HMG domain-containing protein 4 isoform X2 [Hemicordylus capensis]XP_053112981.1 HMG domain-containing protein 4 isoform X2 [Hemicordylus capensis]XP_053112982.1 HMG domain-containing protein 4 isoform X2 [Hemicordylus capensis]